MPPTPSTAKTRCGPIWVGSADVRGFMVPFCSVSGSGDRADDVKGFRVEETHVPVVVDRGDRLFPGMESNWAGGELVVLLHEILSGFQIPQVAVVLVVPVRSLGGTSALGDCPTEVEKPRLGVERQVGRVAVLLGVVLRYREADVCFLCFEVPHDEVILVEEGNVFAVGTDVQGVFGDIAESVFGLSCLEVSESDRERSQGGDTILVDEECP